MRRAFLALAALAAAAADRSSFDCIMRTLAIEYAAARNPALSAAKLQQMADALDGTPEKPSDCHVVVPPTLLRERAGLGRFGVFPLSAEAAAAAFFVSYKGGDDANAGTEMSPFKTVERALQATRAGGAGGTIVLREGTHYLAQHIALTAADSNTVFQAFPHEEVWLSRGTPLTGVTWAPAAARADNGTAAPNLYTADLTSLGLASVAGLRDFSNGLGGKRQIRARFPNADPEINGFGSSLRASSWVAPTGSLQPAIEIRPATPFRPYGDEFKYFQAGSGGVCSGDFAGPGRNLGFDPPVGYWCGNQSEGGGAFTWRSPTGMTAGVNVLPHQPYANGTGMVVQAWHPEHWASRMCVGPHAITQAIPFRRSSPRHPRVHLSSPNPSPHIPPTLSSPRYLVGPGDYTFDAGSKVGSMTFLAGGFQDARGSNDAGEFYVENVIEELDVASEWYYDEVTHILHFAYNGTGAPPTDGSIVAIAGHAITIVNITAPMAAPATGISFLGLGFRDAAYTYLMPHGMPSAGDWGLQRHAALILDGTENVVVQGCVFERLDGNAVIVSGYNRNAVIDSCEFAWIGDTCIAEWGRTRGTPVDGPDGGQDGWDATNGDQPRYTQITNNFAREMGIWEKQSSFLIEAKSSDAYIANNVQFNGPRALINFSEDLLRLCCTHSTRAQSDSTPPPADDGFGGNRTIIGCVMFNSCRESGDHGPFKCVRARIFWDRSVLARMRLAIWDRSELARVHTAQTDTPRSPPPRRAARGTGKSSPRTRT